jgi:hypothetical protein
MCYYCSEEVRRDVARQAIGQFVQIFQLMRILPSANLAIALRMIARQSQSKEWHDALDRDVDNSELDEITDQFYAQAIEYATDGGAVNFDRSAVKEIYANFLSMFARADFPISNPVCVAMLTLSDLILEFGENPPTPERYAEVLDVNLAMFNASKVSVN